MQRIKKNLKWILGIIIGAVLISGISVYATGQYLASQVDYNKNGQANVSDALDDLYNKASNYKYTEQQYQDYGDEKYSAGINANANSVSNAEGFKSGVIKPSAVGKQYIECGFQPRVILIANGKADGTTNGMIKAYMRDISSSNNYSVSVVTNNTYVNNYALEGDGTINTSYGMHIYKVDSNGFGFYFSNSERIIYWTAFK